MLVGGGSGGHITPLLAVAYKLREQQPVATIDYVLETGSRFVDLPRRAKCIDNVYQIRAGKFRRYHGESIWSHLLDFSTNLKNIRDAFYFVIGFFQSLGLLGRLRPDAVFIKGGFVGVPVGLACRIRRIPYFTHDSDTVPGLANRLIAGHALYHAVGMPEDFYNYPKSKLRYTGIPLSSDYAVVDAATKLKFRRQLKLPEDAMVLTVTGGSLGAMRLNNAVRAIAPALLDKFSKLYILHQTGMDLPIYNGLDDSISARITEVDYTKDLAAFTGAADVIVARAGATTIAELAVQAKACVIVPNPQLTGGQQSHNAAYLKQHRAAVVLSEAETADAKVFQSTLEQLLQSGDRQLALGKALGSLAKPDAAEALTAIIIEIASKNKQ